MPVERTATGLQNVDALYWQSAGEKSDHVEAVRVADGVVCAFNSTPLEKYENYRLHLSRWRRGDEGGADVAPTIYNLIDSLIRFLDINSYSSRNGTQPKVLVDFMPEVYSGEPDSTLRRMLLSSGLTEQGMNSAFLGVDERGCSYFPQINCFDVGTFLMAFVAHGAV